MKIMIKDYEYEILEVEANNENLLDKYYRFETHIWEKPQIFINKDLSEVTKRKTLMHEVTHAFYRAYGFSDVTFDKEVLACFIETYAEDIIKIADEFLNRKVDKNESI